MPSSSERRLSSGERKSLPSLVMVSRDLTKVLKERYPHEQATADYLEELSVVSQMSELGRSVRFKALTDPGTSPAAQPAD